MVNSQSNECLLYAYNKGYRINENGVIFNPNNTVIMGSIKNGYLSFSVRFNKKTVKVKAHRLQAYQKFGKKMFEPDIVVRHLNHNRMDASYDNIEIGTMHDNALDNPIEQRISCAAKGGKAVFRLEHEIVNSIKREHSNGKGYKYLMNKYNLSKGSIFNALHKY